MFDEEDEEMNFVVVDRKGHSESAAADFQVQHAGGALPLEQQLPDEGPKVEAAPTSRAQIITPTMADLYMRQGHYGEAAQMLQRLLADKPGDPAMLAKLEECRAKLAPPPAPGVPAPAPAPAAPSAPAAPAVDPRRAQTLAALERWLANARRMSAA